VLKLGYTLKARRQKETAGIAD